MVAYNVNLSTGRRLDFKANKSIALGTIPQQALRIPSNATSPTDAFIALQFLNPHLNGLPIWGPGDAGVTVIREYTPRLTTGYQACFWWSNNGNFLWDGGGSNSYWGFHPYPHNASIDDTTWDWELAGMDSGADYLNTLAGGRNAVTLDVKYVQGARITHNNPGGTGTKTGRFYINLPSTANSDIIQSTFAGTGFGNTNPPSPAVTLFDSPWYADFGHERGAGDHGRIKIFNKVLSEADFLSEGSDMSRLVTSDGAAHIWWGKTNWRTIDDLTCDYGTGRAPIWADSAHKATLVAAA